MEFDYWVEIIKEILQIMFCSFKALVKLGKKHSCENQTNPLTKCYQVNSYHVSIFSIIYHLSFHQDLSYSLTFNKYLLSRRPRVTFHCFKNMPLQGIWCLEQFTKMTKKEENNRGTQNFHKLNYLLARVSKFIENCSMKSSRQRKHWGMFTVLCKKQEIQM